MPLTRESQALLDEFATKPGVTAEQAANLSSTINNSPALVEQINNAVREGHLLHITPLPVGTNAGGEYDGTTKSMRVPLSILTSPPPGVPFDSAEPTFVLGHEIQHGFNHAATQRATQQFLDSVKNISESRGTPHDYTTAVEQLIAGNRRDEARAEIAGWNALVSSARAIKPDAGLEDIYSSNPHRASDFIDRAGTPPNYTYSAKPNISLEANLQMRQTPENIEAMGKNYFDHSPAQTRLGHHGNSDYANYYGAWAMGVISQYERTYGVSDGSLPTQLNLNHLRLSESLMEQNGIDLGPTDHTPFLYLDTSNTPPTSHHFNHTATSFTHIPIQLRNAGFGIDGESKQTQLGIADQTMLHEIQQGISKKLNLSDTEMKNASHNLLAFAKENNFSRIDHVVIGDASIRNHDRNIFLVEGSLNDPAHHRAGTSLSNAINAPHSEAVEKIESINRKSFASEQSPQVQDAGRRHLHI